MPSARCLIEWRVRVKPLTRQFIFSCIGVDSVDISLEAQSVVVTAQPTSGATYEAVLEKIKKTGRTVKGGETVKT